MFEIDDDVLDLDELLGKVEIDDSNAYIADSDNALKLFSAFFRSVKEKEIVKKSIKKRINDLFKLLKEDGFNNELEYYKQFMVLYRRLSEREKLCRIGSKTVVGLGGEFSSGKSNFINSIANIDGLLPEAQIPTTSIPTFIIHGNKDRIVANSVYGYSIDLSEKEMQALTHEFYEYYSIGFSAFIESIIIETPNFSLNNNITMLDTPGYNKYDGETGEMRTVTDRIKAFDQLKITDFLIWLINIENGGFTQDALEFINSLELNKPILVVLNKSDKKSESEVLEILYEARETARKKLSVPIFGITAYSSHEKKEYFGANMISEYLKLAVNENVRNNDIEREFIELEKGLRNEIFSEQERKHTDAREIFNYIRESQNVIQISSLAKLWSESNCTSYRYRRLLEGYDECCESLNTEIKKYLREGEHT